jgi:hypothetical protein
LRAAMPAMIDVFLPGKVSCSFAAICPFSIICLPVRLGRCKEKVH